MIKKVDTLRRKTFRSTGTTDVVAIVVKLGGFLKEKNVFQIN